MYKNIHTLKLEKVRKSDCHNRFGGGEEGAREEEREEQGPDREWVREDMYRLWGRRGGEEEEDAAAAAGEAREGKISRGRELGRKERRRGEGGMERREGGGKREGGGREGVSSLLALSFSHSSSSSPPPAPFCAGCRLTMSTCHSVTLALNNFVTLSPSVALSLCPQECAHAQAKTEVLLLLLLRNDNLWFVIEKWYHMCEQVLRGMMLELAER